MGNDRRGSKSEAAWKISMSELQEMFGVSKGELFQTFLCICNYQQRGYNYKQIMEAVGNNSTIHNNVIQFFAVLGIKAISEKIGEMIDNENNISVK